MTHPTHSPRALNAVIFDWAGTTVDYVEGLQGAGFKFGNPNVKSTCGCGSSFSV